MLDSKGVLLYIIHSITIVLQKKEMMHVIQCEAVIGVP